LPRRVGDQGVTGSAARIVRLRGILMKTSHGSRLGLFPGGCPVRALRPFGRSLFRRPRLEALLSPLRRSAQVTGASPPLGCGVGRVPFGVGVFRTRSSARPFRRAGMRYPPARRSGRSPRPRCGRSGTPPVGSSDGGRMARGGGGGDKLERVRGCGSRKRPFLRGISRASHLTNRQRGLIHM